ncbi:hypothetical protein NC653_030935 [Populus alba x Populus x berolinensis]|uniref:Uncharacterized protein n=1 Tax=Populus alba x Populus x berolinensis TaxID=444605 RepID=A0AAD6LX46_9ROSI|nr:hypothetical protein NC653_030935 [Populus alba x Populus x berolinensis]
MCYWEFMNDNGGLRACRRSQARMLMEVRAGNLSILKKCNKSGTMKIRFGRWRSIGDQLYHADLQGA